MISSSSERRIWFRRVSLTSGAAAQLIVDPAGLVAFGAENKQTAGGAHPVRLGPDAVFIGRLGLGIETARVQYFLVFGFGKPGCFGNQRLAEAGLAQLRSGQKLGVAPSNNVGAPAAMLVATVTAPSLPACATISASFSWCLALRTLCLMPRLVSIRESSSDFSMDTVPTRTGCPFLWHSSI
jgi:hypothetical protein